MSKHRFTFYSIGLACIAAGLLFASLKLPLWQMRMEAPQYRDEEALTVTVFPSRMEGDLREIQTLNQYIGVTIPETLPQLEWLPLVLVTAAILTLAAMVLPARGRRWALVIFPSALSLALLLAAAQARQQMHDIGHNRDKKTVLRGVKDFTPPLFGKTKIFQFEVVSWFGPGAYLIAGAIALSFGTAWLNRSRSPREGQKEAARAKPAFSSNVSATSTSKKALA